MDIDALNKMFLLLRMNGVFNEDGDKKKGKNSYKNNIEWAIKIYNEIKLKGDF